MAVSLTSLTGRVKPLKPNCLDHSVMSFADRMRAARKSRGLTMEALAKLAGCSKAMISLYESGQTAEPKAAQLFALSDALKASPRWLATGRGNHPYIGAITEEEAELMLLWRTLPAPVREHILTLAQQLAIQAPPSVASPFQLHKKHK